MANAARLCGGCGRPLGMLINELRCPCWQAVLKGATIPERLASRVVRARRLARIK
jgi:hypothetical protein